LNAAGGSLIQAAPQGCRIESSAAITASYVAFGMESGSFRASKFSPFSGQFTRTLNFKQTTDNLDFTGGYGRGGVRINSGPFTVEAVYRVNDPDPNHQMYLWQNWKQSEMDFDFAIGYTNCGGGWSSWRGDGGGFGTTTLKLSTWHHVAWVYDGSATRLYADGILVYTNLNPGTPPSAEGQACAIGFNGARFDQGNGGNGPFNFDLAYFRVSKTARYTGSSYKIPRDWASDANTLLLVNPSLVSGTPSSFACGGSDAITANLGTGRPGVTTSPVWGTFRESPHPHPI
jgi:hypothetical protein